MNNKAWESLYLNSQHLEKPASVKGLISNNEIEEIQGVMLEILRSFIEKGEMHIGLKTYIDQELRNDMADRMTALPPQQHDTLESWSQRIFGDQKFGMVLNYLEGFSNSFAEKAANIVSPLLSIAGMPLEGLSFLFFMGNYGFTPFGIHKESIGEEGILFHLGPGNKQFYAWDDPELNSMEHNSQVFHNVEEMLPNAQCYELEPGDAMFVPHNVYHVANTSEFSISFVMDYINPPSDRFENQLFKSAGENEVLINKNSYQVPLKMESNIADWSELLNFESMKRKMEVSFQRRILELKSNGGILRKSNFSRGFQFPNGIFIIQGKSIFPLFQQELSNNRVMLFARGHRIVKQNHKNFSFLLEKLNNGEGVSLITIKELLEPEWDITEIYGFISDLLQVDAVSHRIELTE